MHWGFRMTLDELKTEATEALARARALPPGWWGAIAGAAAAGATIFPAARVRAGVVTGVAALAVALWQTRPRGACCASCAGVEPSTGEVDVREAAAPAVQAWSDLERGARLPVGIGTGEGCAT